MQVWSFKTTIEQGIRSCCIFICVVPAAPGQCCKVSCANLRWDWNQSEYPCPPVTVTMPPRALIMADNKYSSPPVFFWVLCLLIPLTSRHQAALMKQGKETLGVFICYSCSPVPQQPFEQKARATRMFARKRWLVPLRPEDFSILGVLKSYSLPSRIILDMYLS